MVGRGPGRPELLSMVYFLKQVELDLAYEYVNAYCGESLNLAKSFRIRYFNVF